MANNNDNIQAVLDKLSDDDTGDAVIALLEALTDLHRSGGLTALFEMIHLINAGRNALTDGMVERLATFVEHTVSNLGNEEVAELAHDAGVALCKARTESMISAPSSGGILATIRLLSKPETQQSLKFLLSFAGKLRERDLCR